MALVMATLKRKNAKKKLTIGTPPLLPDVRSLSFTTTFVNANNIEEFAEVANISVSWKYTNRQ